MALQLIVKHLDENLKNQDPGTK